MRKSKLCQSITLASKSNKMRFQLKESSGEKLGEVKISFRFSTDRDEPLLKLSEDEVEKEKDNISGRRSNKILVVMEFMEVS